ncbi:MAG: hypothetical protein LBT59_08570 [Clostridiales bacterium]|nr:hypothetical protein [Clostridiales bacterium]
MKTRNDFVTNSSSTLYYISKNTKPISDKTKIAIADMLLKGFVDASFQNEEELMEYEETFKEVYERAREDFAKGRIVSLATVPYADEEGFFDGLIEDVLGVLEKSNELEFVSLD